MLARYDNTGLRIDNGCPVIDNAVSRRKDRRQARHFCFHKLINLVLTIAFGYHDPAITILALPIELCWIIRRSCR